MPMLPGMPPGNAPWYIIRNDDKRRGRLNCIAHILSLIPYKRIPRGKVTLPKRNTKKKCDDQLSLTGRHLVVERY